MSKIAGLKGRSPETYPTPKSLGLVHTYANVNSSSVTLHTNPTLESLLSTPADVLPGNKAIVMYSGELETSGASVLVYIYVILDGNPVSVYSMQIEVTSGNSPVPFSLAFETGSLGASPDPHTIDIQAVASIDGTATVAANGSVVVISTYN